MFKAVIVEFVIERAMLKGRYDTIGNLCFLIVSAMHCAGYEDEMLDSMTEEAIRDLADDIMWYYANADM